MEHLSGTYILTRVSWVIDWIFWSCDRNKVVFVLSVYFVLLKVGVSFNWHASAFVCQLCVYMNSQNRSNFCFLSKKDRKISIFPSDFVQSDLILAVRVNRGLVREKKEDRISIRLLITNWELYWLIHSTLG